MKALLLVQGITGRDNYILDDLIYYLNKSFNHKSCRNNWRHGHSKLCNSEWLLQDARHNYDVILCINTEKFLCNIWSPFRLIDQFGDWFVGNYGKAATVRKVILEEIERIEKTYGVTSIDVLAHSYGTQIMMGVDYKFNKIVFCGSPLTSRHWYVRTRSRNEIKNKFLIDGEKLFYLWNKEDRVCSKPLPGAMRPEGISIEAGRGHTFYNPDKNPEDCYLPHADRILGIRK